MTNNNRDRAGTRLSPESWQGVSGCQQWTIGRKFGPVLAGGSDQNVINTFQGTNMFTGDVLSFFAQDSALK